MNRLVEFPLKDGSTIHVEVDAATVAGWQTVRGAGTAEVAERACDTLEAALAKMRPAAEAIIARLRDLSQPPDAIEVEFGIKLSASAGAVIAAAATEANFKINLTWKKQSDAKG